MIAGSVVVRVVDFVVHGGSGPLYHRVQMANDFIVAIGAFVQDGIRVSARRFGVRIAIGNRRDVRNSAIFDAHHDSRFGVRHPTLIHDARHVSGYAAGDDFLLDAGRVFGPIVHHGFSLWRAWRAWRVRGARRSL